MSGTTQVSRYQKGKTNLDFTGARDSEWQWHQLAPCSREITTPAPHYSVFTGRMPFLPPNQQCQSTEGNKFGGSTMKVNQVICQNNAQPIVKSGTSFCA